MPLSQRADGTKQKCFTKHERMLIDGSLHIADFASEVYNAE